MIKTARKLAIDYCEPILSDEYARAIGREDWIGTRCVRVGEGHEMYKAFLAGYQAAKEEINLPTPGKWISVKDRLPEEGEDVLVFGQYLNDIPKVLGVRARYRGDQEWKYTWEGSDEWIYRENDVTHWMPLPAPPKEEG